MLAEDRKHVADKKKKLTSGKLVSLLIGAGPCKARLTQPSVKIST